MVNCLPRAAGRVAEFDAAQRKMEIRVRSGIERASVCESNSIVPSTCSDVMFV